MSRLPYFRLTAWLSHEPMEWFNHLMDRRIPCAILRKSGSYAVFRAGVDLSNSKPEEIRDDSFMVCWSYRWTSDAIRAIYDREMVDLKTKNLPRVKGFVGVKEASNILGVVEGTVRYLEKTEKLPSTMNRHGHRVFDIADVLKLREDRKREKLVWTENPKKKAEEIIKHENDKNRPHRRPGEEVGPLLR